METGSRHRLRMVRARTLAFVAALSLALLVHCGKTSNNGTQSRGGSAGVDSGTSGTGGGTGATSGSGGSAAGGSGGSAGRPDGGGGKGATGGASGTSGSGGQSGQCSDAGTTDAGWATCNGQCVDLQTDWQNCGACGFTCTVSADYPAPPGTHGSCGHGQCLSPNGLPCGYVNTGCQRGCALCSTATGAECTNTTTDPYNCSACGVVCPASTPCCFAGHCEAKDAGAPAPWCL